jgi:hypothetical protein
MSVFPDTGDFFVLTHIAYLGGGGWVGGWLNVKKNSKTADVRLSSVKMGDLGLSQLTV